MKTAIALGTFDGVHIGHRKVLDMPDKYYKIAVVFSESPKALLTGKCESLMSYSDKCDVLKSVGINEVYKLDFFNIKDMSPIEFFDFIKTKFDPVYVSCGFNYRFGHNASGTVETLAELCRINAMELNCCNPVSANGETVSSSEIRELLRKGLIRKANSLLTKNFSFSAPVILGDQRGRTIGFPTINQRYPSNMVKIKFGVYKSHVEIGEHVYNGITDIGIRPTFKSDFIISETHIIDYSGDLYDHNVRIIPIEFLREEKKFSSLDELKNQIRNDINT